MGGCYLLKYNGGDSGIKISILYWRSVIRGSTLFVCVTLFSSAINVATGKPGALMPYRLIVVFLSMSSRFWDGT